MPDERRSDDEPVMASEPEGDEAHLIYANVVQMSIGPYDVTMDFGYQSPEDRREAADTDSPPRSTPLVRIAMSHGHAKSMIPLIASLVAKLESSVGTIPTPGFEEKSKE